jgi:hypothetical protein
MYYQREKTVFAPKVFLEKQTLGAKLFFREYGADIFMKYSPPDKFLPKLQKFAK